LNREEAIQIYKELMIECKGLNSVSIYLSPPRENDVISEGYQIYLPITIRNADKESVQRIANDHNLSIREINDKIIIYKPTNH
jgi:hypothetical protein